MRFRRFSHKLWAFYLFGLLWTAWIFHAVPAVADDGMPFGGWVWPMMVIVGTIAVAGILLSVVCIKKIKQLKTCQVQPESEDSLDNKPYRLMVENSEEGILILQQLEFRYANQQVYDLVGMKQAQDVSAQLVDYIHPQDLDVVIEAYEKVMIGGEKKALFSAKIMKQDESVLWVAARLVPVTWVDEPAVLAFVRDVTDRKMMEQDLQQAQRMEAIGALSGGIAHDFNNILTTIIGTAEISLMDLDDDHPYKSEFEQIRKSGYRARDLVRQILTISRENAKDVNPLYLTPMIKEAIKLLRSTFPKEIRINEDFDKALNLVRADSIQIYQVFMNLCTNAKHALQGVADPVLEVGLKNENLQVEDSRVSSVLRPGRYVVLWVKDNGTGIDPAVTDKIFEPHFTTKDPHTGTGLGLATALGIIKQHEGCIDFESSSEKGTCFYVYLPVHDPEEEKKEQLPEKQAGEKKRVKILFVDDEVEITTVAERMLGYLGHSVVAVSSGRKALDLFSMSPELFDLLITDLSMPEMSGLKLARAVREIRPDFPIIMCTGYSDTFDESCAQKEGIAAYIEKPYNFKALSNLIASLVKNSKAA